MDTDMERTIQSTTDLYVVIARHWRDWEPIKDEAGDICDVTNITGDNISDPNLVGIYSSPAKAAQAAFDFYTNHKCDEEADFGGPIHDIHVYHALLGGKPGSGEFLAEMPLTAKNVEAYEREVLDGIQATSTP